MLNQIVVVGRLVDKIELNETENGTKVANITLAVQRTFKNAKGEYDCDFIDCVLWKGIAESTSKYCDKGSVIGIKGRVATSTYKDKNEKTRKNVEVVAEKVSFYGYPKINIVDEK